MRRGFTLVEVLVALVVVALTVTVSAPALRRATRDDPTTVATRAVTTVLATARRDAIDTAVPVAVSIDPVTGRYWVRQVTGESEPVVAGRFLLGAEVTLLASQSRLTFVFTPTGPAHADSLVLRTPDGAARVRVDPWTGRIDVQP